MNEMKENYIKDIQRKLCDNEQLDGLEIRTIIAALRESKNCLQEPYYEVTYHDEYGKTESRIMNPVRCGYTKSYAESFEEGYIIKDDRFEVNFRRIVPRKD